MKEESSNNINNSTGLSDNNEDTSRLYTTGNSTLQTEEEHRHDQSVDPNKNKRVRVSNDDLHETDVDQYAGSDRAGTSERKSNNINEASEE